jgi:hypothetical protein
MKFSIYIKYQVITNGYTTKHEARRTYHAADAAMCLSSFINQLAADTEGIITNIIATVAIDHSAGA